MRTSSLFEKESSGGFNLLEMALVMGILVGIAGILSPLFSEAEDARLERARTDCGHIADSLRYYMKDTRLRPTGHRGRRWIHSLISDTGNYPRVADTAAFQRRRARLQVVTGKDTWNNLRWRGPYLDPQGPDPWGRRYIIWAVNFHTALPVWVLSAGRDGILQTGSGHRSLQGDDVGVPIP